MDDLVSRSVALASRCLDSPSLAGRWQHVQAVGRRAEELAITVEPTDRPVLIAAAWLHDIGYGPELVDTGFHPLDGARFLQRHGFPERITALVAHHSGARFEASERGLDSELGAFVLESGNVMDALVTADLTVGPFGHSVSITERFNEILSRYPVDSYVHRAVLKAQSNLIQHVDRTLRRLRHPAEGSAHYCDR